MKNGIDYRKKIEILMGLIFIIGMVVNLGIIEILYILMFGIFIIVYKTVRFLIFGYIQNKKYNFKRIYIF